MPIVTLTENDTTTYYAVTEGYECRPAALVDEFKLSESSGREYAEHMLRREYLRRLTEHAYECAQLAHLVENPPEDGCLLHGLKLQLKLAAKVARDAIWLRTYDPFVGLIAEAVAASDTAQSTALQIEDERVSSLDDDSWDATQWALEKRSPWRRDQREQMEREDAERAAARQLSPAAQKRVDRAAKAYLKVFEQATGKKAKRSTRAKRRAA